MWYIMYTSIPVITDMYHVRGFSVVCVCGGGGGCVCRVGVRV